MTVFAYNDASASPTITWEDPTPANNSYQPEYVVYLNTTIAESDVDTSAFFDWNSSLAGYWNFESYSSTGVYDNSSHNRFAIFKGNTNVANITSGKYGSGFVFNGSGYLLINDTASEGETVPLTIEAWVKFNATAQTTGVNQFITYKAHSGSPWSAWSVYDAASTAVVKLNLKNSTGGAFYYTLSGAIATQTWYHIVVVINSTSVVGYTNGAKISTTAYTGGIYDSDRNITVGGAGGSDGLNGTIDEVRIWNRALTWEEVNASYNNTLFRLQNNFTDLTNGTYNYTAWAIDAEGNVTTSSRVVTITQGSIMNSSRISPAPSADDTDNLFGYCNATQSNSQKVIYNYSWYRNDVQNVSGMLFKAGTISAGGLHTCGIRANDSRVLCWGYNNRGQLGNGSTGGNLTNPTPITDITAYTIVTAGGYHTCGIRANDSRVTCWGWNNQDQLGNGSTGGNLTNPTPTTDTNAYTTITAGVYHTCGILTNGTARCWGDNSVYGMLGDGTLTDRADPTSCHQHRICSYVRHTRERQQGDLLGIQQ